MSATMSARRWDVPWLDLLGRAREVTVVAPPGEAAILDAYQAQRLALWKAVISSAMASAPGHAARRW